MEVVAAQTVAPPVVIAKQKRKRERVSEKKRQRARDLEQELLYLQARQRFYDELELCELLQEAIVKAHRLGEASRKSDRDSVLQELERWAACETEELQESTGLSRWVLDQILQEFETNRLVEKHPARDPVEGVGGRPRWVWSLKHTRP